MLQGFLYVEFQQVVAKLLLPLVGHNEEVKGVVCDVFQVFDLKGARQIDFMLSNKVNQKALSMRSHDEVDLVFVEDEQLWLRIQWI